MLYVYVICISARRTCHPEHEHLCYDGGISHCIPIGYKCDEDPDCNDGSDEDPTVCSQVSICLFVCLFHVIFNNMSVISWRLVLLVEEIVGSGEIHRPVTSH